MLELKHVYAAYHRDPILEDISLRLETGRIGCLLGASGCGKTTLLRLIAGFETPRGGEIRYHDQLLAHTGGGQPVERRGVGMVFQDCALFPHLRVHENISFGAPAVARGWLQQLTELLDIGALLRRYPHELSGGQQQRVALARALAPEPPLLLLDEPFSSLEPDLREQLARELRRLLLERGRTTTLAVSHNQSEAFCLSDRVGVLHDRRLLQWDSPFELYHRPRHRYVAGFIGEGVLLAGRTLDNRSVESALGILQSAQPHGQSPGTEVALLIRPDDILHDDTSPNTALVLEKVFRGAQFLYTLGLDSKEKVLSLVPSHHDHAVGEPIGIRLEIEHLVLFPRNSQAASSEIEEGGGRGCA